MAQITKYLYALLYNVMIFLTIYPNDKSDSAGIVFLCRAIEAAILCQLSVSSVLILAAVFADCCNLRQAIATNIKKRGAKCQEEMQCVTASWLDDREPQSRASQSIGQLPHRHPRIQP